MKHTSLDFLLSTEAPWISVGHGEPERLNWVSSSFYAPPPADVCVRRLRGWKMRTTDELMSEMGAALQLFDGFGENWHALDECLRYLDEWLPAESYVLVVESAEKLLERDRRELGSFLRTCHIAGEAWSVPVELPERFRRPARPFHVLLNVSETGDESVDRMCAVAREWDVPVRVDVQPASRNG